MVFHVFLDIPKAMSACFWATVPMATARGFTPGDGIKKKEKIHGFTELELA